jgi:hypothetical protein
MPTLEASLTTNSNLDLIQLWRKTSDAPPRQPEDSTLQSAERRAGEVNQGRSASVASLQLCVQAWRFWSQTDPSVHYAFGEFADMDALRQAMSSEGFKFLLADYDRVWGSRGVTRTRDILEKVQHLAR